MASNKTGVKIGQRLYALRNTANISQQAVADTIGVKRETINQWESGTRQIKAEHIISLAKFFQVSSDYILGLTESKQQEQEIREAQSRLGLEDGTVELLTNYTTQERRNPKKVIAFYRGLNHFFSHDRAPDVFSALFNAEAKALQTVDTLNNLETHIDAEDYTQEELLGVLRNKDVVSATSGFDYSVFLAEEYFRDILEDLTGKREIKARVKTLEEKIQKMGGSSNGDDNRT